MICLEPTEQNPESSMKIGEISGGRPSPEE
jgi:hypothetical protein